MDIETWGATDYVNQVGMSSPSGGRAPERIDSINGRVVVQRRDSDFRVVDKGAWDCAKTTVDVMLTPKTTTSKGLMSTLSLCELTLEQCCLSPPTRRKESVQWPNHAAVPSRLIRKLQLPTTPPSATSGKKRVLTESLFDLALPFDSPTRKRKRRFHRRNSVVIHRRNRSNAAVLHDFLAACRSSPTASSASMYNRDAHSDEGLMSNHQTMNLSYDKAES